MVKGHNIETSLTLNYRESAWGIERLVLDCISNHLPADSNGTFVSVKLKQDGEYVDFKEADPDKQTEEIVIEDDGSGYDFNLFSVLFSTKTNDVLKIGQFGEGSKLEAAAALRNKLGIEYRSKNWSAIPFTKEERIGGHKISRLCFRVSEDKNYINGSKTIFQNPPQELVDEIFQLPQKVLAFNEIFRELYSQEKKHLFPFGKTKKNTYASRIIDLNTTNSYLFIKGIKVECIDAIFSYDLGLSDISPDRISINREKVLDEIECLLKTCTNIDVIKTILKRAHESPGGYYFEFQAFKNRNEIKNLLEKLYLNKKSANKLWVDAFKELFGENAVLSSWDSNLNYDAELMGFKPIDLDYDVKKYLIENGVETVRETNRERKYEWINPKELTDHEKSKLEKIRDINKIILDEDLSSIDVRIYSRVFSKSGKEINNLRGVEIIDRLSNKYIGIKRRELENLDDFLETYIHELGHYVTGYHDYDREFTDFFVKSLARLVKLCFDEEGGNPNGSGK